MDGTSCFQENGSKRCVYFIWMQEILKVILQTILAVLKNIVDVCKSKLRSITMPQGKSLREQIVLITGAGNGIGRQLALQFAELGCVVACIDADNACTERTVQLVNLRDNRSPGSESQSKRVFGYTCDITDQRAAFEMVSQVLHDMGRVDILVNNVSKQTQSVLHSNPMEMVGQTEKNIMANFWVMSAILPGMIARKHGHVVAISSRTDVCGLTSQVPYSSAQHAIAGLLESFNDELRLEDNNIHLTCAHPYCMDTKPSVLESSHWRLFELSEEFAASEIIRGIRHNLKTFTVPRNLLFWINVFRTLPQDSRHIWQDVFNTRLSGSARERGRQQPQQPQQQPQHS